VNGPVRARIGLNSQGNVFGSGFRANATIGRAVRLTAINVFGLQPHQLDQATQGTLAKYSACIAENEEESPWAPLHVEYGLDPAESAVTALVVRSCMHIEARHTRVPEQLALDLANTIRRTGALIHETSSALVVLGPEHAQAFADAGWGKDDVRQEIFDHAVNSRAELAAVGKEAISRHTHWRMPASHPDAVPDQASQGEPRTGYPPSSRQARFCSRSRAPTTPASPPSSRPSACAATPLPPSRGWRHPASRTARHPAPPARLGRPGGPAGAVHAPAGPPERRALRRPGC
jgi:hypothetical protein